MTRCSTGELVERTTIASPAFLAPAEVHVADIDPLLPEDGADLADQAGAVGVADHQHVLLGVKSVMKLRILTILGVPSKRVPDHRAPRTGRRSTSG